MLSLGLVLLILKSIHALDTCEASKECNSENPHLIEVSTWLKNLNDHKLEAYAEQVTEGAKSLVEIVSCDDPNGAWNFKYTGSKGKRKIFKGNFFNYLLYKSL